MRLSSVAFLLAFCHATLAFLPIHPPYVIRQFTLARAGNELKRKTGDTEERRGGLPNPFKAISKLFKPKEKEPPSEMEQLIDQQFKGKGPLGAIVGAGLKVIFSTHLNTLTLASSLTASFLVCTVGVERGEDGLARICRNHG